MLRHICKRIQTNGQFSTQECNVRRYRQQDELDHAPVTAVGTPRLPQDALPRKNVCHCRFRSRLISSAHTEVAFKMISVDQ
jgi:hypothetical protein